jgi:DNA polymerase-3 subunit delta'
MSWDHIRGHGAVVAKFEQAMAVNRLGQAYLFLGTEGIGKKLVAVELAKAWLCEASAGGLSACGRCASCKLVDARTHPDLVITGRPEDKSEFPIDLMRELTNTLKLMPIRGQRKIAIVDDADDFNEESANAFLKTLEEPPPGTLIMLIGTSADVQLPTILSRCQIVRFDRLTTGDVKSILLSQSIREPDADLLARLSDGRPGRAIAWNDPDVRPYRSTLIDQLTATPFHRSALIESTLGFIEAAGKEAPLQRRRARIAIEMTADLVRMAARIAQGSDRIPAMGPERERLNAFAAQLGPDRLLELIDILGTADVRIDRRVPVGVTMEAAFDALGRLVSESTAR